MRALLESHFPVLGLHTLSPSLFLSCFCLMFVNTEVLEHNLRKCCAKGGQGWENRGSSPGPPESGGPGDDHQVHSLTKMMTNPCPDCHFPAQDFCNPTETQCQRQSNDPLAGGFGRLFLALGVWSLLSLSLSPCCCFCLLLVAALGAPRRPQRGSVCKKTQTQ